MQQVESNGEEATLKEQIRELGDRCAILGVRLAALEVLVWKLSDTPSESD